MSFRRFGFISLVLFSAHQAREVAGFAPSSTPWPQQRHHAVKVPLPFALSTAARRERPLTSPQMSELVDLPSIFTSVETFDGSTVDPVVVSNVFWGALQGKIISVIIGQILAAAVFAILSSMAASQLAKLGDYVKENVFKQSTMDEARATVAQVASSAMEKGKSPTVEPDFGKLLICILVDIIGTSSEFVPFIGEVTDVVWAPIAGLGLRSLFGSNILFVLEFIEEILPFTDILPLATLCWVVETFYGDSDVARALGIGVFGTGGKVVDVESNVIPDKKLLKDATDATFDRIR